MHDAHMATWQAETHVSNTEAAWHRWIDEAETIAGHSMDGDQATDGYSMDGAYAAWQAGRTPQAYVAAVKRNG